MTALFAKKLVFVHLMKSFGRRTAIDQFSLDGNFVKSWQSIKEAARSLGFTSQTISNCLRGLRSSAHGYRWKYVEIVELKDERWSDYRDTGLQISSEGRVKTKTGKISNNKPTLGGYNRIRTNFGSVAVHRMVAEEFIPNPDNKPYVNHKNGIKCDNRSDNLEWVTHQENMIHAELLHVNKHTL